jgi:carbon-monoxide dehydrogenase medium subunit
MKPCAFIHHEPQTVEEALRMLSDVSEQEGRILAGGQTMIAAMALRLARPNHLVDINQIPELQVLKVLDGHLAIGASVRHSAFHQPVVDGPLGLLLSNVVKHIAHLPIRMRGTFCGSLANADAASEWCLVATTLGAELIIQSVRGQRRIKAEDFFLGYLTTALEADEMLLAAHLPLPSPNTQYGFDEHSMKAGDFAKAMALVSFVLEDGVLHQVRIGVGAVEGAARRIPESEAALELQSPTVEHFAKAADLAAQSIQAQEATEDENVYKRQLVRTVVMRAFEKSIIRP